MIFGLFPPRIASLTAGTVAAALLGSVAAHADCAADLGALAQKRAAINALLESNKKAHGGKIDPVSACPQLKSLASAQAAVVSYMQKNKDWCSLPDELVTQSAKAQSQIAGFAVKACGFVAQMKKMQEQAAQQQAAQVPQLKLPAGPL